MKKGAKNAIQKIIHLIKHEGIEIPVAVVWEPRRSIRAAIGKDAVTFRLPNYLTKEQQQHHLDRMETWLKNQLVKQPALLEQFTATLYRTGEVIWVGKRSYLLHVNFTDKKTHTGNLKDGVISLDIVQNHALAEQRKAAEHLISRLVARDFQPAVEQRVAELNRQHFGVEVKSVNLKYNHSNWGSCSRAGNINLSTRLLFAPDDVIDYVIIHELAHRVVPNHSARFWNEVARVMPDYQKKEQWLKLNGSACKF